MRTTCLAVLLLACFTTALLAATPAELSKRLESKDNEVRRKAAQQLSEIGNEAKPALAALLKATKDSDRFVRRFTALALGNLGGEKGAIEALTRLLDDDNQQVRDGAIRSLAKIGKPALASLSKALEGTSDLHEKAIEALNAIGPDALSALIAAFKNAKIEEETRRKAMEYAEAHGKTSEALITALLDTAKNGKDPRQLRLDAMDGLGMLAKASHKDVVALLKGFADDRANMDVGFRDNASNNLKKVQDRK
jgi:hypothetical protein